MWHIVDSFVMAIVAGFRVRSTAVIWKKLIAPSPPEYWPHVPGVLDG
jgi:hypothetical protein